MLNRITGAVCALAAGLLLAVPALADAPTGFGAQGEPQLAGDWEGTLTAGGVELTIVFHITEAEDGTLSATLDSPDQGAFGIPCDGVTADGNAIEISVGMIQGSFTGTLNEDGTIDGTWTQPAAELPLLLTRVDESAPEPEEGADEG